MKEQAVNTFKGGLVMDLNPMAGDGTTLSNALNATLITNNGNELMLQNDMGNGRINKVRLDEGYIPVGIKEHGGIIYIASYNPENKKGQIGSFPYPKVEWDNSDFIDDDLDYSTPLNYIYGDEDSIIESQSICTNNTIYFNEIIHDSQKVKLFITKNEDNEQIQAKFKQGDSFSLIFDHETSEYLKADNIEATIVSKTASDYVTLHTISKEELEKGEPISVIYNHPYSGTLFLQISLNVPDTFDISYTYNNGKFIVYPYAYNSENPEIYTTIVDVMPLNDNKHISNFDCGLPISLGSGEFYLYPVTQDKGYLNYLKQKIYLNRNKENNIFKYTFNNEFLNLYWDIYTDKSEYQGGEGVSYRFTYNFYDLETASSVKSLQALQKLSPIQQVVKDGYAAVSGVRNLKCSLPSDTIYVLLITVAKKSQDTYSDDMPCFGGFIYGTPRYNEFFESEDNFNEIEEETHERHYSFNRQLLELNRTSFKNRHYLYNPEDQKNYWEDAQGIVLFSDNPIAPSAFPIAYSTEIGVSMSITEEPVIVAPSQNTNFIYDSDQFSVDSSKFSIDLRNAEVNDVPSKNENTRIITSLEQNIYKELEKEKDHITFYRYISSESSDGQAQQTRTFKQLMPVFNPSMSNYEELFGFDYTDATVTGVFASKNYLNKTETRSLSVGTDPGGLGSAFDDNSQGNSSPGIIKQFLLLHSKEYRGQDVPSIFDIFSGSVKTGDHQDDASLRIENGNYMPYHVFGGLDPDCAFKEFDGNSKYIIPTCLTYTNQPLLLPLPSSTIGLYYNSGYQESYGTERTKYPKNTFRTANNLHNRGQDLLIPAFKKLFCLLSQLFTLQTQETYTYVVGPSEVTVNYNIQDNSYVKYTAQIEDIFIDENIQTNLNNTREYLEEANLIVVPQNYIGRLKLQKSQNNYFFYGREINMDSELYNNVLSQYITAYDESTVIDNSSGYSSNDIYYLDAYKIYITHPTDAFINSFDYEGAHQRISNNSYYPMDNPYNGVQVIDGDYNKIWKDLDIYYNPTYNCYQYDLSKENFVSMLTKATRNSNSYLLDWAGNAWIIPSLASSFMTIEEAKSTPGSTIGTYLNNYIVLRNLNTVSSTWVEGTDKPGPSFAKIDLGFRGCLHDYSYGSLNQNTFLNKITSKIQEIINLYNHNKVAVNGGYEAPISESEPTEEVHT